MSGSQILAGMREAVAYARGETVDVRETVIKPPAEVDVKAIREYLGLSQQASLPQRSATGDGGTGTRKVRRGVA